MICMFQGTRFSDEPKISNISFSEPCGAFYFYVDISKYIGLTYNGIKISSVDKLAELLLESAHIAVVPGTGFGDPNGIRLSYAVSTKDVQSGLERLHVFLQQLS